MNKKLDSIESANLHPGRTSVIDFEKDSCPSNTALAFTSHDTTSIKMLNNLDNKTHSSFSPTVNIQYCIHSKCNMC